MEIEFKVDGQKKEVKMTAGARVTMIWLEKSADGLTQMLAARRVKDGGLINTSVLVRVDRYGAVSLPGSIAKDLGSVLSPSHRGCLYVPERRDLMDAGLTVRKEIEDEIVS
jgi:hypothetical protein